VSNLPFENAAEAAFRLEMERRVEQSRASWAAFASTRSFRTVAIPSGLPAFTGVVEGTLVEVSAMGDAQVGYRTRASAASKIALRGTVIVAPPDGWRALVAEVWTSNFFGDSVLDQLLVVKTSSASLAHAVLDARVVQTVRTLAPERLELYYGDGVIRLEWGGVERQPAILSDVVDVLAYLAVQGSETTPYR
jgi:hypothetical protein